MIQFIVLFPFLFVGFVALCHYFYQCIKSRSVTSYTNKNVSSSSPVTPTALTPEALDSVLTSSLIPLIPAEFYPQQSMSNMDYCLLFQENVLVNIKPRLLEFTRLVEAASEIKWLRENPEFIADCHASFSLYPLDLNDMLHLSGCADGFALLAKRAIMHNEVFTFFNSASQGNVQLSWLSNANVMLRLLISEKLKTQRFTFAVEKWKNKHQFLEWLERVCENPIFIHDSVIRPLCDEDEVECPICYSNEADIYLSPDCGHLMCQSCLELCLESRNTDCPLCKAPMTKFKKHQKNIEIV